MPVEILDLHSLSNDGLPNFDMPKQILDGLSRPVGQKQIPTMLLYDEQGLRLYDDITTAVPEYYLFGAEEEILKNRADEIVGTMHRHGQSGDLTDEVVLELGAGQKLTSPITYYALDLEKRELERTLGEINNSEIGARLSGKVTTKGMCGTYDDGLKFVQDGGLLHSDSGSDSGLPHVPASIGHLAEVLRGGSPVPSDGSLSSEGEAFASTDSESGATYSLPSSPIDGESVGSASAAQRALHIMFLGSSIGNFPREEAASFLRSLPLRAGMGDTLLLGLDHDNAKEKIEEAYNDKKGYTRRFIMNGLRSAGRTLGDENLFDEKNFEYVNTYNEAERRHEAYFKSKCSQVITEPTSKAQFKITENELLKIEESIKYSEIDAYTLFTNANLRPIERWTDSQGQYSLWLLERPPFMFPLLRSPSLLGNGVKSHSKLLNPLPFSIPSRQEWEELWDAWDFITRRMIPPSMLHEKPIDLRHICLFYFGHIPTFLDIHLSRLLGEPHTEPDAFKYIFERGIDPDVDDPNQCHPHSEVPTKEEDWPSLDSILTFQSRVRARLMKLYDNIDNGAVPLTRKVCRVLFLTLEHEAMHAETLLYMLIQRAGTGTIPPAGFTVPHWKSLATAWNEAPVPDNDTVVLGPETITLGHDDPEDQDLQHSGDDALNHEYGWDNESPKRVVEVEKFSISWRPVTNGEFYSFFTGEGKGKVERPASWIEEDGVMKVRTFHGPVPMDVAYNWPVITSYDSISTYAQVKGGRLPTEPELRLFYDKFEAGYEGGANVGFRSWHPVPATTGLKNASGRGTNGGVWEWTSTVFDKTKGFVPSILYPGYSADFFDGKHQVVLGGSYATIPRITERRSFRNWYQRNYPYAWVGGRIVYDA
ncbi:hypothetical protein H1R20_g9182, partial [Candolleomyces eurysporus]